MSKAVVALAGLMLAAAAVSPAAGQAAGNQSPANRMPRAPQIQIAGFNLEGELFREGLDRQALASQPADRLARAERVAALVDSGKCDEALDLARSQKDHLMARRVREICRTKAQAN